MYFPHTESLQKIHKWFDGQLLGVYQVAKDGIDIEVKPHRKPRTIQQNKFLMAILVAQVRFYNETGFMLDDCKPWMMKAPVLKEYWKDRYGAVSSSKLSTTDFSKLCDFIQNTLIVETQGEWQLLEPDSAYLKSLIEEAGI